MKTFLAIFTGSPSAMEAWQSMDAAQRQAKEQAGMAAWKGWADKNQSSIVDQGAPLGKTKRVAADGITDIRNNIGAYTVVQAESHQAAAKLFEQHPHFTIFPGDGVEVMECLPMPTM
jgi:leucyl aminopeptidase (aminopeptidase T)